MLQACATLTLTGYGVAAMAEDGPVPAVVLMICGAACTATFWWRQLRTDGTIHVPLTPYGRTTCAVGVLGLILIVGAMAAGLP